VRALRNLLIFVVVLLVVGVIADIGTKRLLENRIEAEIEGADRTVDVGNVDAEIKSFPFLGRLGLRGEVDHFNLRLEDLVTPGVTFQVLQLTVDGVTFDRSVLLNARVQVQHLDRATIKAEITEAAASEAVGVPVTFTPGTATVEVAGQARTAAVAVVDGDLSLSAEGVGDLTITLSETDYFPCVIDATVKQGKVVVRCTATELPPALRPFIGGGAT
jgi:hypothetical protein